MSLIFHLCIIDSKWRFVVEPHHQGRFAKPSIHPVISIPRACASNSANEKLEERGIWWHRPWDRRVVAGPRMHGINTKVGRRCQLVHSEKFGRKKLRPAVCNLNFGHCYSRECRHEHFFRIVLAIEGGRGGDWNQNCSCKYSKILSLHKLWRVSKTRDNTRNGNTTQIK